GLTVEAGIGEVGRSRPHLLGLAADELHDELVVRDRRPGAGMHDRRRQSGLADRRAVLVIVVLGVVIDDLYVDAAVMGALERLQDRKIGEFIGADPQALAVLGVVDVFQAGLGQPARQPFGLGVAELTVVADIVDHLIGQRRIVKLGRHRVAGDGAAIEPDALALLVIFGLGRDREGQR